MDIETNHKQKILLCIFLFILFFDNQELSKYATFQQKYKVFDILV